jgi:MFS family permease
MSRPPASQQAQVGLLWMHGISMPMGVVLFNVMPLFALRLGAGIDQVGLIYALIWGADILQYLAAPEVAYRQKKRWMITLYSLAGFSFTGIFLVPIFSNLEALPLRIPTLICVVGLYNIFVSMALSGWSAYIQKMIPLEVTGKFLGNLSAISSISWLVSAAVSGMFLGGAPALWRYYGIFGLVNLMLFLRVIIALRLPADPMEKIQERANSKWCALLAPIKDTSMLRYCLVAFSLTFLLSICIPLFPVFFRQVLNIPEAMSLILLATPYSIGALFGKKIGNATDLGDFYSLTAFALFLAGISLLAVGFLPRGSNPVVTGFLGIAAIALFGLANTITLICLGRERFARVKDHFESEYLGLGNASIGIGAVVGSVLGGVLPGIIGRWFEKEYLYNWLFGLQSLLLFLIVFLLIIFRSRR